jgi:hypothetical protein
MYAYIFEMSDPFFDGGEERRLLQHDLASRGWPARGASPDDQGAGGGSGSTAFRVVKGRAVDRGPARK